MLALWSTKLHCCSHQSRAAHTDCRICPLGSYPAQHLKQSNNNRRLDCVCANLAVSGCLWCWKREMMDAHSKRQTSKRETALFNNRRRKRQRAGLDEKWRDRDGLSRRDFPFVLFFRPELSLSAARSLLKSVGINPKARTSSNSTSSCLLFSYITSHTYTLCAIRFCTIRKWPDCLLYTPDA